MTITKEERRQLIQYGYEMEDKARRCRTATSKATWLKEKATAWQMAGYTR